jgi:hypothetical protein
VVLDDAAGVEKAPLQGVGDGRVVAEQAASLRRLVLATACGSLASSTIIDTI